MIEPRIPGDVDFVRLAIQELVEFGDKLVQLSEDEERAILGTRMSEKLATILPSYLSPLWTTLRISWLTEEQNPGVNGGQRASRGILEIFESLYHRVADPICESEVFVALICLWTNLGEMVSNHATTVAWGRRTNLSANTQDLYDRSIVRVVNVESMLNEVGSRFDSFPGVTSDQNYAMDRLFEFVPPGRFVVIWVVRSWLLTTRVAEEFCVGKLPERESSRLAIYGFTCLTVQSFIEQVRDAKFLETGAGESNVGACNWDQALAVMFLVILDGFAIVQDFRAGSDQRQQMLCKTLPKFNRFTDLKEEKDLIGTVRLSSKTAIARKGCGCAFSLPTYLPSLR